MNIVEPLRNKADITLIEDFLATNNKRNRLIFIFGINAGLRISDILALNIGDVKDKQSVVIREKKTGKPLCKSQIEKILKNPFYCGYAKCNEEVYEHIYPKITTL